MSIPTEGQVRNCLSHAIPVIRRSAEVAFEKYRGIDPQLRLDLDHRRVFASVIWNLFWAEMRRAVPELPGCRIFERNGTFDLIAHDKVLLRFKRVGPNLLSRNYPTQTNLDFYAQLDLPGIPASLPRLEIGWREDDLRLSLGALHLVMRVERRVEWSISLLEDQPGVTALPLPIFPQASSPRVRTRHAVSRGADESAAG